MTKFNIFEKRLFFYASLQILNHPFFLQTPNKENHYTTYQIK